MAPAVHAQTWTADLYAGGTRYEALADRVSTTNLIGTLRHATKRNAFVFLSLAAPLDGDATLWGAGGGAARLQRYTLTSISYGIDLSADGYAFRDEVAGVFGGVSAQAMPFAGLSSALGTVELRGGWQQHVYSYADTSGERGLLEVGARAQSFIGTLGAQLDARWLHAGEADYPYAGVQLAAGASSGRVWAWTGKWLADELDDVVWGVGAGVEIPRAGELWATFRYDAGDPLYQSLPRRSWNVGFSRQIGGARGAAPALLTKVARGAVQLRLPVDVVPDGGDAAPSVAGEFNDWKPVPMRRVNGEWVIDLPLGPGVYRFAFVSATGDWFVPEQYPGRMDDGMGGHVAVIVVP